MIFGVLSGKRLVTICNYERKKRAACTSRSHRFVVKFNDAWRSSTEKDARNESCL